MVQNKIACWKRALFLIPVQRGWSVEQNALADPLKNELGTCRSNSCREVVGGLVLQGRIDFDLVCNVVR